MSPPVAPTALDRTLVSLRALVLSFLPALKYWIVHEYSVHESDGATFSGLPTDATFSPQLPTRVPYAPALAGATCIVPQGTLAYVGFANADPSKPYLVRFGAGATSTTTTIDAGTVNIGDGFARIVREGDVYTVGVATGPITFVSTTDTNGPTKGRA